MSDAAARPSAKRARRIPAETEAFQGEPRLTITAGKSRKMEWNGQLYDNYMPVLVEVQPPGGDKRIPCDICVVLDISGSMNTEAVVQNAGGAQESHGLTLLDIAKHGVRTIIATLNQHDRLSIVWFNDMAGQALALTAMDKDGQDEAVRELEEIRAGGGTSIWAGLEQGMNSLKTDGGLAGRMSHLMLLTDGQTRERGSVMQNLKEYKERHEQLPGTLSTFGFGYNIDSPLLADISSFGAATYSFIPDAGFVGTVFVNTLSNLLVTFAKEAAISIDMGDAADCAIIGVHGLYALQTTDEGVRIELGTLQYVQPRSVVLLVKCGKSAPDDGCMIGASLSYQRQARETKQSDFVSAPLQASDEAEQRVGPQRLRCMFVEAISQVVEVLRPSVSETSLKKAQDVVRAYIEELSQPGLAEDTFVQTLKEDAEGQSQEAVSRAEWYRKWGCHYLPSIIFAHKAQQCNNFKDPGVQAYGGELFREIVEEADNKFNSLPPPRPSSGSRFAPAHSGPAPAVSMSSYNDRYGG